MMQLLVITLSVQNRSYAPRVSPSDSVGSGSKHESSEGEIILYAANLQSYLHHPGTGASTFHFYELFNPEVSGWCRSAAHGVIHLS